MEHISGGWATPLKNMISLVGIIIPNVWKSKKQFPNHQPDMDDWGGTPILVTPHMILIHAPVSICGTVRNEDAWDLEKKTKRMSTNNVLKGVNTPLYWPTNQWEKDIYDVYYMQNVLKKNNPSEKKLHHSQAVIGRFTISCHQHTHTLWSSWFTFLFKLVQMWHPHIVSPSDINMYTHIYIYIDIDNSLKDVESDFLSTVRMIVPIKKKKKNNKNCRWFSALPGNHGFSTSFQCSLRPGYHSHAPRDIGAHTVAHGNGLSFSHTMKRGVSIDGGTPKWMVHNGKSY